MELVLSIIIGFVLAFVAILVFEWSVSPRLEIRRAPPDVEVLDFPPGNPIERFLRVQVVNKPLSVPVLTFLSRRVALRCRAYVSFFDETTKQRVPSPPLPESVRWTNTSEGRYEIDPNTGRTFRLVDSSMFPQMETLDIGPNTPQPLDLVVKRQGDTDIYMHNALNLMNPTFQHPANRLSGLSFRVEIYVRAENAKSKPVRFIIRNLGGNLQDLTLHAD